jgi:hypothetical protein
MIVYGLDLLFGRWRARAYVLAALIAVFVLSNIDNCAQFQRDAYKQESLLRHFANDPAIREGSSFVVDDQTHYLDANQRQYRFYEYAGMLYAVFGEESRFAIRLDEVKSFPETAEYWSPGTLLGGFNGSQPNRMIRVTEGPYHVDASNLIKLMLDERVNPVKYEHEIWDITRVQVVEYTGQIH